jgi:hypothetical protein
MAIFYVLIYIEITKKSGILSIVDNAPSWIVLGVVNHEKAWSQLDGQNKFHRSGKVELSSLFVDGSQQCSLFLLDTNVGLFKTSSSNFVTHNLWSYHIITHVLHNLVRCINHAKTPRL